MRKTRNLAICKGSKWNPGQRKEETACMDKAKEGWGEDKIPQGGDTHWKDILQKDRRKYFFPCVSHQRGDKHLL